MLEWDSDSTMLLLHMRLHQNEANSHNKLLNCKNLVLDIIFEDHKYF